jgi:hypothetical protein
MGAAPTYAPGFFAFGAASMKENNWYLVEAGTVRFNNGARLPEGCVEPVGYWENDKVEPKARKGKRVIHDYDPKAATVLNPTAPVRKPAN